MSDTEKRRAESAEATNNGLREDIRLLEGRLDAKGKECEAVNRVLAMWREKYLALEAVADVLKAERDTAVKLAARRKDALELAQCLIGSLMWADGACIICGSIIHEKGNTCSAFKDAGAVEAALSDTADQGEAEK